MLWICNPKGSLPWIWLQDISSAALKQLPEFKPQELASTIWGQAGNIAHLWASHVLIFRGFGSNSSETWSQSPKFLIYYLAQISLNLQVVHPTILKNPAGNSWNTFDTSRKLSQTLRLLQWLQLPASPRHASSGTLPIRGTRQHCAFMMCLLAQQ